MSPNSVPFPFRALTLSVGKQQWQLAWRTTPVIIKGSIVVAIHLHLPITVLTRFRATSHREWISRSVSRKPCSKQWTATSEKHSAVQTIKTRCSPMLKWNGNCWDGSWNCQEVAGRVFHSQIALGKKVGLYKSIYRTEDQLNKNWM